MCLSPPLTSIGCGHIPASTTPELSGGTQVMPSLATNEGFGSMGPTVAPASAADTKVGLYQRAATSSSSLGLVPWKYTELKAGTNPSSSSSTRKMSLDHMELLGWMGRKAIMSGLRVSSPTLHWLKATHSCPPCITSMSLHARKSAGVPWESGMSVITIRWPSSAVGYGQYGWWSRGILHTASISSPWAIWLRHTPRASGTWCSSWQFGTHTTVAEKIKSLMPGGSMPLLLQVQQSSKARLHSICSALSKSSIVVQYDNSVWYSASLWLLKFKPMPPSTERISAFSERNL